MEKATLCYVTLLFDRLSLNIYACNYKHVNLPCNEGHHNVFVYFLSAARGCHVLAKKKRNISLVAFVWETNKQQNALIKMQNALNVFKDQVQ